MDHALSRNRSAGSVCLNALLAAFSLFANGLGVYLTIHAGIGAGPWDVFHLGVSKTFGVLYGSASITISLLILAIDILLKEPVGVAMFIDALVVGKSVDFFTWLDVVPVPASFPGSVAMLLAGLTVMGYTQYLYMRAGLGCGPRDTLLVGLAKRLPVPIGAVSVALMALVTGTGWLLGGKVGAGTLICAFCAGPIMQLAFATVRFDATAVRHQSLGESWRVLWRKPRTNNETAGSVEI